MKPSWTIAEEAIRRTATLYAVEKEACGRPLDKRARTRLAKAGQIFDDLEAWITAQLLKISRKSPLAAAIRYALTRLKRLRPYLDHGILELDNCAAERAMRGIAKTDSLCTPFSNGGKQRFLIVVFGATRAFACQFGLDPLIFEVAGANLVGRAAHDLLGGQEAIPDETTDFDV